MHCRKITLVTLSFLSFLLVVIAQDSNDSNNAPLLNSDQVESVVKDSIYQSDGGAYQSAASGYQSGSGGVAYQSSGSEYQSSGSDSTSDDLNQSTKAEGNGSLHETIDKNSSTVALFPPPPTPESTNIPKVEDLSKKTGLESQPISKSEQESNFWSISLLIILLAVLVIKVILSQGEIKRLNLRVDDLSSGLSTLDQKTWGRLTSTLEKIQSDSEGKASVTLSASKGKAEKSHALQLAVFNEIERIEARLTKYDESDKNRKPMMKALERLEETLSELGYEREKLVGAKYVEGKNYEARFIPSKDPAHETPTITRVYKPSILLNGKLIQPGEVEVSEYKE